MIKHMDVEELEQAEDAVVIDVREPEEHARGALPDAVNIPLADFLDKVESGSLEYAKKQLLIVHCTSGSRSLIAAEAAKKGGYAKAYNLRGGYAAWQKFNRARS